MLRRKGRDGGFYVVYECSVLLLDTNFELTGRRDEGQLVAGASQGRAPRCKFKSSASEKAQATGALNALVTAVTKTARPE